MGDRSAQTADGRFDRPAFYALRAGGWRDLVTLLHPPYTAWHLSLCRARRGRGAGDSRSIGCSPPLPPSSLRSALPPTPWTSSTDARSDSALGSVADRARRHLAGWRDRDRDRRRVHLLADAGAVRPRRWLPRGRLQPRVGRGPLPHGLLVRRRVGRLPRADVVVGQHARARPPRPAGRGAARWRRAASVSAWRSGASRRRSASCAAEPRRSGRAAARRRHRASR